MKYLLEVNTHWESLYAIPIAVFDTIELLEQAISTIGEFVDSEVDREVYHIDYTRRSNGRVLYFWTTPIEENVIKTGLLEL